MPKPMSAKHPLPASTRPAPRMCSAHSKQTGQPCRQHAVPGTTVCHYHGGKSPHVLEAARRRIAEAAPGAVETLIYLSDGGKEGMAVENTVRRMAASDILDRAGVKEASKIDVTGTIDVTSPLAVLTQRLAAIAERAQKPKELEEGS